MEKENVVEIEEKKEASGTYMGRVKIQENGKIVIPKRVREVLDLDIRDKVALEPVRHGKIQMTKA